MTILEKHRKTIKITGLKENNLSWKQRKQEMHKDNQRYEQKLAMKRKEHEA